MKKRKVTFDEFKELEKRIEEHIEGLKEHIEEQDSHIDQLIEWATSISRKTERLQEELNELKRHQPTALPPQTVKLPGDNEWVPWGKLWDELEPWLHWGTPADTIRKAMLNETMQAERRYKKGSKYGHWFTTRNNFLRYLVKYRKYKGDPNGKP